MTPTPYLYRPIAAYQGRVLKCAGIATPNSRVVVAERAKDKGDGLTADGYMPGFIELPDYAGDRITADTHTVFKGI